MTEQLDASDVASSSTEDEDVSRAVARERALVGGDLRAVVAGHLHRLISLDPAAPAAETADHARAALGATHRAAALGGLTVPGGPAEVPHGRLRRTGLVVGSLVVAVGLALAALVAVLLPGTVAAGPVLVLALAVAIGLTGRHAPLPASAAVLVVVLGVLAVAAPFATTTAPAAGAVAGAVAVELPLEPVPESGACLLLGVVLAAAWGVGLHRRRRTLAVRRLGWLSTVDALGRCGGQGRLGLPESTHRTLVAELTALTRLSDDDVDRRRARVARHRLAGVLPTITAVDLTPGGHPEGDAVLDEGRVAVLVATAQHAALAGARHTGRPPSVVVCGVPATDRPEVGLLAARLLAELVTDVASRPGPVAASVAVEHRDDAVVLEVASGRGRLPAARAGRVPTGLVERAALLDGTVEVTSTTVAFSVRVVLPTRTRPVAAREVAPRMAA